MAQMRQLSMIWMALPLILALAGCGKPAPKAIAPPSAPTTAPAAADVRIVSLSPAITRTLADLQLVNKVVGRTPHCRAIDQNVPVVGDLLNVNYELLVKLEPTHVLVQPPAAGLDPELSRLANERGWNIATWRLNTVDDIEQLLRELPAVLFADGSPGFAAAARRSAEIQNNIAQALTPASVVQGTGAAATFKGRVLLISSVDPVMAFGAKTYLNDILVAQGGVNAVTDPGWVQLSLEDVARLDPDAMIVVKPGDQITSDPSELFGALWESDNRAVLHRLLGVIRHPDALLPSSAVVEVAGELRKNLKFFAENSP